MTELVYLDHAATSPLRPEAREAMLPWLGPPANPSSSHRAGRRAAAAAADARHRIAALLGADPRGVVFTSGATEANHLAVRGLAKPGAALGVGALEHPCVRAAARWAETVGVEVSWWGATPEGLTRVEGDAFDVVSMQAVNHETGVVQPWRSLRERFPGAWVHVDAAQALTTSSLAPGDGVDALTLSAHKLGGPAGVGALVLGPGVSVEPLFPGPQERGRRAGTPSVASIVGFAAALEASRRDQEALAERAARWQARIERVLQAAGAEIVGDAVPRVPTHSLAVFPGLPGEALVSALDLEGIAVSVGAACASGSAEPSPVLTAMGSRWPLSSVRVSTGWSTSEEDIAAFERVVPGVVARTRAAFG